MVGESKMRGPWVNAISEYYMQTEDYDNEWFNVCNELSEEELKQQYIEIFGKIYSLDELNKIETRGMSWNELQEFVRCKWMPVIEETFGTSDVLYLINDDLDMVEYCLMCEKCGGIKKQYISIDFDNYGKDLEEHEEIFFELYRSLDFPDCECEEN